jgi:transcriptional regulator
VGEPSSVGQSAERETQNAVLEGPNGPIDIHITRGTVLLTINRDVDATRPSEVPYGMLDLMVLKTLEQMGPLRGYGIARRIEQITEGMLALNQGTIYPALLRLEQKAWVTSEWGSSENNRRARFYSIRSQGRSSSPRRRRTGIGRWR